MENENIKETHGVVHGQQKSFTRRFTKLSSFKWQGIMWFLVIIASVSFGFMIYRFDSILDGFDRLINILKPIIVGVILAYILNPVMKWFEKNITKLFKLDVTNAKTKGRVRGISLLLTIILFFVSIGILLYAIIPDLIVSLSNLASEMPQRYNAFARWLKTISAQDDKNIVVQSILDHTESIMEKVNDWLKNDLLDILKSLMNGITGVFGVLYNFFIGLIVSIYILSTKESFKGTAKKCMYAMFSPKTTNSILTIARDSDRIFLGFLSGKLIDSLIMGVICFVVLSIFRMPYTLIVSVIVGITNIIPFFGPYIGVVPSTILIALADPKAGLIFFIFDMILQQIDGNIIGPKILGNSTGLSAFGVIFAILLGSGLFGFPGMIFGVPVFAVIYHLAKQIIDKRLIKKELPTETDKYVDVFSVENSKLMYKTEEKLEVKEDTSKESEEKSEAKEDTSKIGDSEKK
ncbi:MAG: AI-2E family transporter [Lachnospiraceae bacterium]|nr:AI-2E family transporter [Lachnospiraceae bacterium]